MNNGMKALRVAAVAAIAIVTSTVPSACGLESDGSHKAADSDITTNAPLPQLGRYRTEAVRLGVNRPLLLLIDTATGLVLERNTLGSQKFRPVTDEPAPGADLEVLVPGRYDVKVVPVRRGSALLRLDTATGSTWFVQLGASQREWKALPSSLRDAPKQMEVLSLTRPGASPENSPDTPPPALAASEAEPPSIESIVDVLTNPGYETELRIWTASQMASIYPADAAQLLSTAIESDDVRVMLAIIDGVDLDADARVRVALERLRGHENPEVAEAIRQKLGVSD